MKVQVGVTARRDPETGELINTEKIVRKIRKDSKFASELCLPYGAAAILCAEFLKYTEQKA